MFKKDNSHALSIHKSALLSIVLFVSMVLCAASLSLVRPGSAVADTQDESTSSAPEASATSEGTSATHEGSSQESALPSDSSASTQDESESESESTEATDATGDSDATDDSEAKASEQAQEVVEEAKAEWPKSLSKQFKASDGAGYVVSVTYGEDAAIPDGVELAVQETEATDEKSASLHTALELQETDHVFKEKFFSVALAYEGEEIIPQAQVEVEILTTDVQAKASDTIEMALLGDEASEKLTVQNLTGTPKEEDASPTPLVAHLKTSTARLGEFGMASVAEQKFAWKMRGTIIAVWGARSLEVTPYEQQLSEEVTDDLLLVQAFGVGVKTDYEWDPLLWITSQDDAGSDEYELGGFSCLSISKNSLARSVFGTKGTDGLAELPSKDIYALLWKDGVSATDNKTYKVSVHGGSESGLPRETEVVASELKAETEDYDAYVAQAAELLGASPEDIQFAKVMDISLKDAATNEACEPTSEVGVRVSLLAESLPENKPVRVIHFAEEPEVLEAATDGNSVEFATGGFSTYAIVSMSSSQTSVTTSTQIQENTAYHLSNATKGLQYATAVNDSSTPGLGRSTRLSDAGSFYFQKNDNGTYYLYVLNDEGQKQYLKFEGTSVRIQDAGVEPQSRWAVTILDGPANTSSVYIRWSNASTQYLNKYSDYSGTAFAGWNQQNPGSRTIITKADEVRDAYGLEGKPFVIVHNNQHAMSTTTVSDGLGYTTVTKNSSTNTYEDTDASNPAAVWSFEPNDDGTYAISTTVGTATKYLSIEKNKAVLTDVPHYFSLDTASKSGYVALFGDNNKVLLMFNSNRFMGTDSNLGDNHYVTLGVPSAYISYQTVIKTPTGAGGAEEDVRLNAQGVRYTDGLTIAAPSQNPVAYFPDEGSNEGWLYEFEYWVDASGNRYNVGDDIKAKFEENNPSSGISSTALVLTSVWTRRNNDKQPIYTVVNHLTNTTTYTFADEPYSYTGTVSELADQPLVVYGSNTYTSTSTAQKITGYADLYNGAIADWQAAGDDGSISISIPNVNRDYEFFPTYSESVGHEAEQPGTYHFVVVLNKGWIELQRPYYMDTYVTGSYYAWQNAYLHKIYEKFYNASYEDSARTNATYKNYVFGHNAKDTSTTWNRKPADNFTTFFATNNASAQNKYLTYTPFIPASPTFSDNTVSFPLSGSTAADENLASESFFTVTLSDDLKEKYDASELASSTSLITGTDVASNAALGTLSADDVTDDYKSSVEAHNVVAFNNRECSITVTAPNAYKGTDLMNVDDNQYKLVLMSVNGDSTEVIAPSSMDADANTYTYTIPANKMTCAYEVALVKRDPWGFDNKNLLVVSTNEAGSVAMNATASTASNVSVLSVDAVKATNDRYSATSPYVIPTLWKFEVVGAGNGLYTISNNGKYVNINTGNNDGKKHLTLTDTPQTFRVAKHSDGKYSIQAVAGPGAFLHYYGNARNFSGYYAAKVAQPDLDERFILALPTYDVYYAYPKSTELGTTDTGTVNNLPIGYYGASWSQEYTAAQPRQDYYFSYNTSNMWVYNFKNWTDGETTYEVGSEVPNPANLSNGTLVLNANWKYDSNGAQDKSFKIVRYVINAQNTEKIVAAYPLPTVSGTTDCIDVITSALTQKNYAVKALDGKTYYKTSWGDANNQNNVYEFAGWKTENNQVLSAETTIDLTDTSKYDKGKDGIITLTATWNNTYKNNPSRKVMFFLAMDAVSSDATNESGFDMSSSGNYTKGVFYTLMQSMEDNAPTQYGNDNQSSYPIVFYYNPNNAAKTAAANTVKQHIGEDIVNNGYGVTSSISDAHDAVKALAETGVTIKDLKTNREQFFQLLDFPTDSEVMNILREKYSNQVRLDGQAIDPNTLTTDYYTVRWYVCKDMSDGWHVDGKLTPKASYLTITKTFSGDEEALEKVEQYDESNPENSYYIEANNTNTSTTYGQNNKYKLVLKDASETSGIISGDADSGVRGYTKKEGHTYTWVIRVRAMSHYNINERNWGVTLDDGTEYGVIAQYNNTNAETGQSTAYKPWIDTLSQNAEEANVDYLRHEVNIANLNTLNLYNTYVPKGTFVIQKVAEVPDGKGNVTEKDLSDVYFKIYDEAGNRIQLTETSAGSNRYSVQLHENEGTQTGEVKTNSEGKVYLTFPLTGEERTFIVEETVPSGYLSDNEKPSFKIHVKQDNTFSVETVHKPREGTISTLTQGNPGEASYQVNGVKITNVAKKLNIHVAKAWRCVTAKQAEHVTFRLTGTAKGKTVVNQTIQLYEGNGWQYTWANMPRFSGNNEVTYKVEEIKIGENESGSNAFNEWSISYATSSETVTGSNDEQIEQKNFTVTNTLKDGDVVRVDLKKIAKGDTEEKQLEGYEFHYYEQAVKGDTDTETEQITYDGTAVGVVKGYDTITDGDNQQLQLVVGRTYYLQEATAPTGYASKNGFIKIEVSNEAALTLTAEPNSDWSLASDANESDAVYVANESNVLAGTLTVKNEPGDNRKVILRKVNEAYGSLKDAKFTVYRGSSTKAYVVKPASGEGDSQTLADLVSASNGIIWVGELPSGVYYVEETAAPSGYTENVGKWFYFEVDENGASMPTEIYTSREAAATAYTASQSE